MVDTIGLANAVGSSPDYTGRQLRQLNAVAFAGATAARPLGALTGVRFGTPTNTVTVTGTTWACGEFAGLADLMVAGEAGPYPFAFDASTGGSLTPADSSNPRIDIVYTLVTDPEDGTTVPTATRLYLAGTASATPVAPAAPTGAFTVAQISVPKAGTGSPSVTWVAPVVVAAGGIIPYATKASMPSVGLLGQVAIVDADPTASNNRLWYGTGTGWTHSLSGGTPFAEASGVGSNPNGAFGAVTFPTGRFTVPPLVFLQILGGAVAFPLITSVTATGFSGGAFSSGGSAVAGTWNWQARQMTATTAAG
jgi:hypothetical protein